MFHLLKDLSDTYTWPVSASVPTNGGKVKVIKFDAEFKRLDSKQIKEMLDQENESRPKTDDALINEVLAGIKCKDESGAYSDVSNEDVAQLRSVPGIDRAITMSFYASLTGEKAKN